MKHRERMLPLLEVLKRTTAYFEKAGVENPRAQTEWLMAHAIGCRRLDLFVRFDTPLTDELLEKLRPLVKRRAMREPLQYILGTTPFHELTLRCDRRALIPRPETEQLVEEIALRFPTPPARVLDLGTGTGAIALSLAKIWPAADLTALDASADALALAAENAAANGLDGRVRLIRSDWFENVDGRFDLIVSNPPYLTLAEWESAAPEVKNHEPYEALVAENEGLADLEMILRDARDHLEPGGTVFLETGIAQHAALEKLATQLGYAESEGLRDLSKRPRFFRAKK
ncbi:MAG: peptide chain release factor N(5)-glutamine methyltransferase [Opitutales bacterium]|jgi:release factor glutamine methyltransferase